MNFREFFLATKNFTQYNVHSSFSNNYLLKHGNVFSYGTRNEFCIPVPDRNFLKKPKIENSCPEDRPHATICSSVCKSYSPISEHPVFTDNGKQETWILGSQKLSWDNSTVASYNPETKMFRCVVCNAVGFLSRIAEHYLGTHTSAKVFQCMHCPYSSTWSRCVRMHMAKHHGVPNAPPSLWKGQPLLEEIFHLLNTLKSSVDCLGREKNDVPDKKFVCTKCPYNTDRRDLFLRHENIHKEEKPFHCYLCLKLFNRADHVKKHFLRIHRGQQYDIALVRRRPSEIESRDKALPSDELVYHLSCDQSSTAQNEAYAKDISGKVSNTSSLNEKEEKSQVPSNLVMSNLSCLVPTLGLHYLTCPACSYICANQESMLKHAIDTHDNTKGVDARIFQEHQAIVRRSEHCNVSTEMNLRNMHSWGTVNTFIAARKGCCEKTNESIIPVHSYCGDLERKDITNAAMDLKIPNGVNAVENSGGTSTQEPTSSHSNISPISKSFYSRDSKIQPESDPSETCDIVCRHCGCEFADVASLKTHTKLYHRSHSSRMSPGHPKASRKPFLCVVCQHRCTTQVSMIAHMRCHSGPSLECHAEQCTFTALFDSELRTHVTQRHNDGIRRCPHCGVRYSLPASFARHYTLSHHPYPCVLCRNAENNLRTPCVSPQVHFESDPLASCHSLRSRQSTEKTSSEDKEGLCSGKRRRKQSSPRKIIHSDSCRGRTATRRGFLDAFLTGTGISRWSQGPRGGAFETRFQQFHTCRVCEGRSVRYRQRKSLILHHLWLHSRRKFFCNSCGTCFKLHYQLIVHSKKCHSEKDDQDLPLSLVSRHSPS